MIGAVVCILASSLLGDLGAEAPAEKPVVVAAPVVVDTPVVVDKPVAAEEPVVEEKTPPAEAAVIVAAEAERPVEKKAKKGKKDTEARSVKITSDRTDFDRKEGVIMFDRNVFVDDAEYQMHADQLYVFLDTNNLDRVNRTMEKAEKEDKDRTSSDVLRRIVAIGNVSITNDTRVGSCAKAVYTKATSKIVMYGDEAKKQVASLMDNGKRKSQVEGKRITFWIDTEQVEVEGSTVTLDAGGFGGKDGTKKLLGK